MLALRESSSRANSWGAMRSITRLVLPAALVALAGAFSVSQAAAKPARCFTTDDGYFPCDFQATDGRGSFRISAPGYPAYMLEMDQPGFASGFIEIDGRSTFLPGQYVRSSDDPACWSNPETGTKICAW